MITKITGKLIATSDERATMAAGAFEYEVLIPAFVRRQMQGKVGKDVSLHTIEYLEGNPTQGRLIPRMVGFLTTVEREFFEQFCSVDGVGVRKALRAMVRPVRDVAVQIEEQDTKGLSTLPGIGARTAEKICAKLRHNMSRFALMIADEGGPETKAESDLVSETYAALLALGHSEPDARNLIDNALKAGKHPKDIEGMLQLIYQQSRA